MKNIITATALLATLFTSTAFADYVEPIISTSVSIENESILIDESLNNKMSDYEVILRNNLIKSDYEYNNSHYFTSKITTDSIIIPEEIKEQAERIYFLVEEGSYRKYYKTDSLIMADESIVTVTDEYNYKIVDFVEWKTEYIFNNEDLLTEFKADTYYNVNITLIAELTDTKKVLLSNNTYVSISDKENTLQNIYNNSELQDNLYFGYYNSNDLEIYLEKLSADMTRSEYKDLLSKADSRIKSAVTQNNTTKDEMLESIQKDSDFEDYIAKYKNYSETRNLLSNLGSAITNQLQNIRAFDAIDAILK